MGSYASFNISSHELLSMKSYVSSDVASLFKEMDRKEETILEDDGEERTLYSYQTTVKNINDRLDVMGFTLIKSRILFEEALKEELDDIDPTDPNEDEILMRTLSFNAWMDICHEVLIKDIQHYNLEKFTGEKNFSYYKLIVNRYDNLLGFDLEDERYALRAILSKCKEEEIICLDVTELIYAGYYETSDAICESSHSGGISGYSQEEKVLIITEGSTDAEILNQTLNLLHPHLTNYFAFLEFHASNIGGGAPEAVKLIKAFIGAGVKNRIIAILDNDTAANEAVSALNTIKVPTNIQVMRLPLIEIAASYPTVGPQGDNILVDVNGSAVSTELFVCKDLLKNKENEYIPVIWKGYNSSLKQYQGEISKKGEIQEGYMKRLDAIRKGAAKIEDFDWENMLLLFREVFRISSELH